MPRMALITKIAADNGVSIRTIYRWLQLFKAEGVCGLQNRPRSRKTNTLNER